MTTKAKHGDIVKVRHALYVHYGVYVETSDDPHIIHYTGENGPQDFSGMIRETPISVFLNGETKYSVCEFDPKNYKTIYSGEETVKRAKSKLGERNYNFLTNNCEHFAVWCKTGEEKCFQLRDLFQSLPHNLFSASYNFFSALEEMVLGK